MQVTSLTCSKCTKYYCFKIFQENLECLHDVTKKQRLPVESISYKLILVDLNNHPWNLDHPSTFYEFFWQIHCPIRHAPSLQNEARHWKRLPWIVWPHFHDHELYDLWQTIILEPHPLVSQNHQNP